MIASVIIACKTGSLLLDQCLQACDRQIPRPEIIVLPDVPLNAPVPDVRVIVTGEVSPAHKRDWGAKEASSDLLVFLDDDAYPAPGWIEAALRHFSDSSVGAVGGPGVTPPEDDLYQQAGGAVYASVFGGGGTRFRYVAMNERDVDDFPTCNLFVRKQDFFDVGGFDTTFWPGEDTKLCLDLVYQLKKRIVYDPKVLVFHHRRPLFLSHLRQVGRYGKHRGYFVKRFPQTSFRLSYFVPSVWLVGVFLGSFSIWVSPLLGLMYGAGILFYMACIWLGCLEASKKMSVALLAGLGTMATHVVYGWNFMVGLLSKRLREETVS